MKKQKNFIVLLFFIVIFFLIGLFSYNAEFEANDECWNFQNIYKMYNGSLIYKEINVIITPLFFEIANALFHIFSANLFIFRLYNILIYSLKMSLLYLIFRKLNMKKHLSILYISLFLITDASYILSGANYNQLALVFCLIGTLLYIFNYPKKYCHFWEGIVIYLVFFTKQTVGIYYALGIVLFELVDIGFHKEFFKNQYMKLATFLSCLLLSLAVMYARGNLFDFANLCFGGILEFGNSNFTFAIKSLKYIFYAVITIIFTCIILINKNTDKDLKKNIIFLLCMSLSLSFNMYPLANEYHSNMAMLFYFILFVYVIDRVMINELLGSIEYRKFCFILSAILLVFLYGKVIYLYCTETGNLKNFEKDSPFYNCRISSEDFEKINTVTNYITKKSAEGTKVIFLTHDAFAYMVPLNLNNNEFDLLFSGNLGYHGIQKTIDKIANMHHTEFLIFTDEENCFYQESKEIREYIQNNLKKTGELFEYSIYTND